MTAAVRVLGVDSGGTGLRFGLAPVGGDGRPGKPDALTSSVPVRTGAAGIDPDHLLEQLLPAVRTLLDRAAGDGAEQSGVAAVCVGAAGMATLGAGLRAALPAALAETLGVRHLVLAADAVTAYAGALGERPGAVVAAGTGMIAMGTDLREWRRADGWGHLLGDCGSGAWIGRAGLEAAMRAHDGREGGSAALLARAEAVLGPATSLPGLLYPRTDRAAVLASFAPEVARCAVPAGAADADPVAVRILRDAAREIARAAEAVCPPGTGPAQEAAPELALAGGLFRIGEPLTAPLAEELAERLPHVRSVEAAGDPLDGALLIAARLAAGALRLPSDPAQLTIHRAP